ncbi:unnamed protein product [Phaedon cochleariae]|uniref:Uncharacterized protein n=1 Tax=Phaedon cochleariae TaxID=80249 RepID=A0A9P0GTZ2_PHACE|nr:unnamed protein product [Phaedon cochleariae]
MCLGQDITNIEDIQTLSELPLEKLLSLKKVFRPDESQDETIPDAIEKKNSASSPEALALQNQKPMTDRGGNYQYHYEEEYHPKEGKNKIQSIFQISVTALAFLAFGGYLLCLLIHAINSKQHYYSNQNATTAQNVAAIIANRLKRKNVRPRIRKRPNSNAGINSNINTNFNRYRRDGQHNRTRRGAADDSVTDKMYDALINLAEGFTNYHTVDYVHLNRSGIYNIDRTRFL